MADALAVAIPDAVAVDSAAPAGTPIDELTALAKLSGPEVEVDTAAAPKPLDFEVDSAFFPVDVAVAVELAPARAIEVPPVDALLIAIDPFPIAVELACEPMSQSAWAVAPTPMAVAVAV